MSDAPELPPRPLPRQPVGAAVAAWLRFVGWSRLLATALSVMVVVAGGLWLLRSPEPPVESAIPMSSGSIPSATLPPPSAAPSATDPGPSSPVAAVLVVHVAGAVGRPGLYELPAASRAGDAVDAAGGPTDDGDLDALNLAAPLVDGGRVYVPRRGEVDPASVPSVEAPAGTTPGVPTGPIDLNTATAADLESLPGVGPATAAAIVDDRTRNGPFASVDDLDRVPGIGPAKLAALRDQVTV